MKKFGKAIGVIGEATYTLISLGFGTGAILFGLREIRVAVDNMKNPDNVFKFWYDEGDRK